MLEYPPEILPKKQHFYNRIMCTLDGGVIYTEAATQKIRRVQILEYQIDTTPFLYMRK